MQWQLSVAAVIALAELNDGKQPKQAAHSHAPTTASGRTQSVTTSGLISRIRHGRSVQPE